MPNEERLHPLLFAAVGMVATAFWIMFFSISSDSTLDAFKTCRRHINGTALSTDQDVFVAITGLGVSGLFTLSLLCLGTWGVLLVYKRVKKQTT